MRRGSKLRVNQSISVVVSYFLVFSPLHAADLEVDGTTNTTLDVSRNDIPVVNIADPNSNGLSHNKFKNYNVNSNGLILNNSKDTSVNTQLSGYIYGNKNLNSNAKVILNEITSSNRSRLNGYTEIAGQVSDLVIANPNGISINGAGFINTNNVTITTGKPNILNGNISSFSIKGGDISIEGNGLDTSAQISTHIYTSYLQLNAKVHANDLDIKLGSNEIDYNTKEILSSSDSSQTLLLDSSALGGMYANKIALVGTSSGVGVNLPPEVLASTGDITITNDGKISLQKLTAKTDVNVKSNSNSIEVNDNIYGVNTNLNAADDITTNDGVISAQDTINLNSNSLNNKATVLAGLNEDQSSNSNGKLNITNQSSVNSGKLNATDSIELNTKSLANSGTINSAKTMQINASDSINNDGTINSNDSLTIKTATLTNTKDISSSQTASIDATTLKHNGGKIASNSLNINSNDISTKNAQISADTISIDTQSLSSENSEILAVDKINLNASSSLNNGGKIQANNSIELKTDNLTNTDTILSKDVKLDTKSIVNSKDILSTNDLTISQNDLVENSGNIKSNDSLNINTAQLNNNNNIAAKTLKLNTTNFSNKGSITSDDTITIDATNSVNENSIIAANSLNINSTETLNNSGSIHSNDNSTIKTKTLTNTNSLTATDDLNIEATTSISNTNAQISAETISIDTQSLSSENSEILAVDKISLNASSSLNNGGKIQANNSIELKTNNLTNADTISSKDVQLDTKSIVNTKDILATNDLTISQNDLVENNGNIKSNESLNIKTAQLNNNSNIAAKTLKLNSTNFNNKGSITSDDTITIDATNSVNENSILAANSLNINSTETLNNSGSIHSNQNSSIKTKALTNTNSLTATNDLNIEATTSVSNTNEILANNVTLNTDTLTNSKDISAVNDLNLKATTSTTNNGTIQANNALTLNSANLTNNNLVSAKDATLTTTNLSNTKSITASNDLTINTNTLTNTSSSITANNNLNISASSLNNSSGTIKSNKDLTINSSSIDNSNGNLEAVNDSSIKANSINLTNSNIFANHDQYLKLDALNNISSSTIGAGNNLTIDASGYINNYTNLIANGILRLYTTGALTNYSTLAGGTLDFTAASLANYSTISGGSGSSSIYVFNDIYNASRVSGVGNLSVRGNSITNNGYFNSGNDLTITSNYLTNNRTLFASNDMNLYTNVTLQNNENANIFAMNNLMMAANSSGGRTGTINNYKGNIETYNGDITIYASTLKNYTDNPVINTKYEVSGFAETWTDQLVTKYKEAKLQSSRNLYLNVNNITNQYSNIFANGSMSFNTGSLNNTFIELFQTSKQDNCGSSRVMFCDTYYNKSKIGEVSSKIYASNSINGSINTVNNGDIKSYQVVANVSRSYNDYSTETQKQGSSSTIIENTLLNAQSYSINEAGVSLITITSRETLISLLKNNPEKIKEYIPFVTIEIPTDDYGLFVKSKSSDSQYLIETNPEFTMYANFISSNYMMEQIEFTPDITTTRLGDDFYENKLIRESIYAQTGRTYLNKDLSNDYDQYKYLMDNAISVQDGLNLVAGISLSADQINALTKDIVWMEEKIIDGVEVLVPVVYIANADNIKVEGSSIIAGDSIDLDVENLANSGTISSGGDLAINASDKIDNVGGIISANEDMSLTAKNDINNIAGTIKGDNVSITSENGNIVNKANEEEILSINVVTEESSIQATNSLNISANDKVEIIASEVKASDLSINADTINIESAQNSFESSKLSFSENVGSNIEADNISLNSTNDINIKGSNIAANGDMIVQADNLNIESVQDTYSYESPEHTLKTTINQSSNINADNLTILADGEVNLKGSNINVEDSANIVASGVNVESVQDTYYEKTVSSKGGMFKKSSTTTVEYTSNNVASNINGGNINIITTKGDIDIIGSNLNADESLALDSAADVNIQAGYDGSYNYSQTTTSRLFTAGAFSKSETDIDEEMDKTYVASTLKGKNVLIRSANDTNILGSDIEAEQGIIEAKGDVNIAALENEHIKTHIHHESSVGWDTVAISTGAGFLAGGGGGALGGFLDSTGLTSGDSLSRDAGYRDYEGEKTVTTTTTLATSTVDLGDDSYIIAKKDINIGAATIDVETMGAGYENIDGELVKTNNDGDINIFSQNESTTIESAYYSEKVNRAKVAAYSAGKAYLTTVVGESVHNSTGGAGIPEVIDSSTNEVISTGGSVWDGLGGNYSTIDIPYTDINVYGIGASQYYGFMYDKVIGSTNLNPQIDKPDTSNDINLDKTNSELQQQFQSDSIQITQNNSIFNMEVTVQNVTQVDTEFVRDVNILE